MRATWLAEVLRASGCRVVELPGWQTRGVDLTRIEGVVYHATVTGPNWPDDNVAWLLRDGRPDLSGPLSQLGLSRNLTWYVIAAGKAHHNGYGRWGNQSIGVEEFNLNGLNGQFEPFQEAEAARGIGAILRYLHMPASRVEGHKEQDPGRKSDPVGVDMTAFRVRVQQHIDGRVGQGDDDMTDEQDRLLRDIARRVASLEQDATVGAGQWDTGKKNGIPVSGRMLLERVAQRLKRVEDKVVGHAADDEA